MSCKDPKTVEEETAGLPPGTIADLVSMLDRHFMEPGNLSAIMADSNTLRVLQKSLAGDREHVFYCDNPFIPQGQVLLFPTESTRYIHHDWNQESRNMPITNDSAANKARVADTRDGFTNQQKERRGDFIHGANWALKFLREQAQNRRFFEDHSSGLDYGFGSGYSPGANRDVVARVGSLKVPTQNEIAEAAKARFPLEEIRDRIVQVSYTPVGRRLSVVRYLKVVNGEVRFFEDPKATVSAPVPPLTPEVVAAMNDVSSRPTESVVV